MGVPRAQKIFQAMGLILLAALLVQALVMEVELPPEAPPWLGTLNDAFVVLGFLLFGAAFWWCTSRGSSRRTSPSILALLGFQALLGFGLWTDLFLLLAAEVPFVLPQRVAVRWMAAQAVITVLAGLQLLAAGGFVVSPGTEHLPRWLSVVLTLVTVLIMQGFAFCVGYVAATERSARADLARVNAELRATQELLADSTRMAERLQISRELHDTLGHHLTVLSLNLEHAKQVADGRAAGPIADAQAVTRLLLADVRGVVGELRDDRALDLRGALETLAAGTPEPRIHFSFADGVEVQDPAQAHILFRCVQEAITNAVRHARARNLWIVLAPEAEGVALRVRDDGDGVPEVRPGNGLTGMRERVEESGGRLEVESRPGAGFALTAWVPGPAGWP
ncbi:MAG TPA: sensor histidine kinase [Thermoanaerobaculia bacterium]|nr:sensor histidine kinase [Thermoanaerobaculia bacterium]